MSQFSAIRISIFLIISSASFLTVHLAHAQNEQGRLSSLPFLNRNKAADRSGSVRELSMNDGPWLIMCASFSGDNAEHSAIQLARVLQQHKLKTYLYRHSFDYSGTVTGLGWQQPDEDGNFQLKPLKMKPANLDVVQETAVLVGDFPTVDDARAQKVLKKIKTLQLNDIPGLVTTSVEKQATPLHAAILFPNPMLPDEYFQQPKIDKFIVKVNKKLEYSLLKCPGLYTVKVASFRGKATVDQEKIRNGTLTMQPKNGGAITQSRLIEAEEKAHNLTTMLRKKGVEAYEFHDRTESYVCIGSFDWVTQQNNDRVVNNPEVVKVVEACKAEIKNLPGAPNSLIAKSFKGILFDPEPTPIMVPRSDQTAGRIGFLRR